MEPAEGPSWSGRWVWCTGKNFWQRKVIYLYVGWRHSTATWFSNSTKREETSTRLLSCSLGHANNLPLMLRAENTDTSLGFRICFSVKRSRDTVLRDRSDFCGDICSESSAKSSTITVRKGWRQLTFDLINLQNVFSPPAELRWTRRSSSVEPSLSATALVTSLPVAATATRIVV